MCTRKVPKLRFPEFSNTNENNRFTNHIFDDIFHFSTGKNIKQSEASPDFEIPCVRYGELYHLYDEVVKKIVNKTNLDKDVLKFSHGDEILLPSAGEDPMDIGSASALTIRDVAIGRTINILRPKQETKLSQTFVSYYINQRLRRKIATLAKGVSISNVYNSDLKKLKINLPSYTEQKKIADFLSSLDHKIQQLRRKKELLEEYKKGVMQKLFSQEIRFKDKNGEDFSDWEIKPMDELFDRVTRKNKEDNQNVLTISAQKGLINQEEYFNRSVAAKDLTGYYLIKKDEFAYNKSYSNGYPLGAIKRLTEYDKGIVSTLYICFELKENNSEDFYEEFLDFGGINHEIYKIAQEGSRNHGLLNVSVIDFFKDIEVPRPSHAEQKRIASFVNSISDKIDTVSKKLQLAEEFKKGLLHQMFV